MDQARKPTSTLFSENKQDLFEPKPDLSMSGQPQIAAPSMRSDFAAVSTPAIVPVAPSVADPAPDRAFDAAQVAYRAETVSYSLQNHHQGGDTVALGSSAFQTGSEAGREAFKLGGEFVQGLFGAFSDKSEKSATLDDDDVSLRQRAPAMPSYSAPSPSGGMA